MWQKVSGFFSGVKNIFGKNQDMKTAQKELETLLITQDVHIKTAQKLLQALGKTAINDISDQLQASILNILKPCEKRFILPDVPLAIILVCGVNGSGKTTSIAKLCRYLNQSDVGIVAADTFRAAATEQLVFWAEKLGVPVFKGPLNSDPASIVFQSITWAHEQNLKVLIIDTAGRLQNKQGLMDELGKIYRVIQKQIPNAPHETLLVLDGTTGNNTILQAQMFNDICPITGLIMTKLDGTAKGGALISIADLLKLPIYFLGTGEQDQDLIPFNAEEFIEKLV